MRLGVVLGGLVNLDLLDGEVGVHGRGLLHQHNITASLRTLKRVYNIFPTKLSSPPPTFFSHDIFPTNLPWPPAPKQGYSLAQKTSGVYNISHNKLYPHFYFILIFFIDIKYHGLLFQHNITASFSLRARGYIIFPPQNNNPPIFYPPKYNGLTIPILQSLRENPTNNISENIAVLLTHHYYCFINQ